MPWASGAAQMDVDSGNFSSLYMLSVGSPVTSEDVDTYDRLSQVQSRSEEQRSERLLRLIYGGTLLALLSGQVVAVTTFTFLIGFGVIEVDRWVTTTFIGGTLGQVSAMTFTVVRYLFPVRKRSENDG